MSEPFYLSAPRPPGEKLFYLSSPRRLYLASPKHLYLASPKNIYLACPKYHGEYSKKVWS